MSEKKEKSRAYAPVFSRVRRVLLIFAIIILIFFIFAGLRILRDKKATNIKMSKEIENLENDIKTEEEKKDELSKTKNESISDEEYMSIARDELGLIKKDEIVIKPR